MKKSELVIELGVEEIPASIVENAARQFSEMLDEFLKQQHLPPGECTRWYTPRRIIVGFQNLPVRQEDMTETITGPPKGVGYDPAGLPTKAAVAFARKNKVPLAQIKTIATPKGEYLSVTRRLRGSKTHKILESVIPSAIEKIQFPKTMVWNADQFRFVRPLRWVVALFDGRIVRFKISDVSSSRYSSGHRFLGKGRIAVDSLASLKDRLRQNSVIADPEERFTSILKGLKAAAGELGGRLLEDPDLLRTVVNLNEAPSVVSGRFEQRFLSLPKEVLITVMREHQKYFSVLNDREQLLPAFLAVVNVPTDPDHIIRGGHERVLRARLADAAFFWDTDRKTKLADREAALHQVLFQEKLGSYYDKSRRVLSLLPKMVGAIGRRDLLEDLETAGRIFKCDLMTEMVKEFTDLQGIMGGLYARAEGYGAPVWRAIYEQYYPKGANGSSPSSETGALLALVDRLDTICGCFSVGLIPSSSGDPFALRRHGNGILKIIFDHRLSFSLAQAVAWSLEAYDRSSTDLSAALKEFFELRLRFLFEEMGFSHDSILAILAAGADNPLDALERLRALEKLRQEPEFLSLASNFKRVVNIVSKADSAEGVLDAGLFEKPAETELWQSYLRIRPQVDAAKKNHDYGGALRSLASMRNVVDAFFNEVMVMAEEEKLRNNRICLLRHLTELFGSIADMSKIVIEKSGA